MKKKTKPVEKQTKAPPKKMRVPFDTALDIETLREAPNTARVMSLILEGARSGQMTPEIIREYLAESAVTFSGTPNSRLDAFRELLLKLGVGGDGQETSLSITIVPPKECAT